MLKVKVSVVLRAKNSEILNTQEKLIRLKVSAWHLKCVGLNNLVEWNISHFLKYFMNQFYM